MSGSTCPCPHWKVTWCAINAVNWCGQYMLALHMVSYTLAGDVSASTCGNEDSHVARRCKPTCHCVMRPHDKESVDNSLISLALRRLMEDGVVWCLSQNIWNREDQPIEEFATLDIGIFDDDDSLHCIQCILDPQHKCHCIKLRGPLIVALHRCQVLLCILIIGDCSHDTLGNRILHDPVEEVVRPLPLFSVCKVFCP